MKVSLNSKVCMMKVLEKVELKLSFKEGVLNLYFFRKTVLIKG